MPSYQVIAISADAPNDLARSHEFDAADTMAAGRYADGWAAANVPANLSVTLRVFAGRVFLLERDLSGQWHAAPRPQST